MVSEEETKIKESGKESDNTKSVTLNAVYSSYKLILFFVLNKTTDVNDF